MHGHALAASSALVTHFMWDRVNLGRVSTLRDTLLQRMAQEGHEAMVRQLLDKGGDVGAKDSGGRTALSWAAVKGHEVVVQLLLDNGADVDATDSERRT